MADPNTKDMRETHQFLTYLAWGAVAILTLNVASFIGEEVGDIIVTSQHDWLAIFNGFWIGVIKAMPTILIAWAISDFATLFGRCSEGEILTEQNVKTLRKGGECLIWAAIWSAFIAPNLLMWIAGEYKGLRMEFRDLALAVGMMGLVIQGLGLIFTEAVRVKAENDEFF